MAHERRTLYNSGAESNKQVYGTDITGNEVCLQSKQHSFIIAE